MKKLIALFIAVMLVVSLAACGNTGKNDPTQPAADNTTAEPPQDEETTEATDAPTDEPQDDAAAAAELNARLCGDWIYPDNGPEMERLTFNADGTGSYRGLEDRNYTFTYEVYIDHRAYANGAPYDENILKVNYSTGETENIIFFFNDNGQMAFHNFEDGGYTGMMYALDLFTKE